MATLHAVSHELLDLFEGRFVFLELFHLTLAKIVSEMHFSNGLVIDLACRMYFHKEVEHTSMAMYR